MQTKDLLTEKCLRQLEEMVTEISPQDLNAKFLGEEIFQLVDVSDPGKFAEGRIAGAINIPLDSLVATVESSFKKFQQVVLYHDQASSSAGTVAARRLQRVGFFNVVLLRGGKEGWKAAGLALVDVQEIAAQTE